MKNSPIRLVRDDEHRLTVETYLEEWLWGKQSLRASTHASYELHIRRYLVPALGLIELTALGPRDIDSMFRHLAQSSRGGSLSASTLRRVHATLMSALNTAVRRGLLDRNPAATVELPRVLRPRVQTWTREQLVRFLLAAEGDELHLLFWLLAFVGMRRGEVVGLRWFDLNLGEGLLTVEQTMVKSGKEIVVGPPKSRSGSRTVALDQETLRRLRWHECRQRLQAIRRGGPAQLNDLVFTTPAGTALDPAWVSRRFDVLVAREGLPRITLHGLRHTSASLGLASGEPLIEVSRRLGHSSIAITADVYSHISPEETRPSAERRAQHILNPR